ALEDLSRYGFDDQEDKFDPGALSHAKVEDTVWGVPQDTGPVATLHNRQVRWAELRLDSPAAWEVVDETAGIVSEAGKNLISLDPFDGSHPIAWVMQSGAPWFRLEGEGWIVDMTDDASMRVAEFWDQIFAD